MVSDKSIPGMRGGGYEGERWREYSQVKYI
jgi:hypothetical protein